MAAQMATVEKMNRADRVVFNSGTKERLREQILAAMNEMREG